MSKKFYVRAPNGTIESFKGFNGENSTVRRMVKTAIYVNNTNFLQLKKSFEKYCASTLGVSDYIIGVKTHNNVTNQVWLIDYENNEDRTSFLNGADIIVSDRNYRLSHIIEPESPDMLLEKII